MTAFSLQIYNLLVLFVTHLSNFTQILFPYYPTKTIYVSVPDVYTDIHHEILLIQLHGNDNIVSLRLSNLYGVNYIYILVITK